MKQFLNLFLRVIWKNRVFSILNIAGLAVGMASFIIIVLWVVDELSYDRYNENADRIVRVVTHSKINGRESTSVYCPSPLANAANNDFPELENTVRLRSFTSSMIQKDDIVFNERDIIFADSTFFNVFTVPLIKGDPDNVLVAPRTIVLSESTAKKYFGDEDPVGQLLLLNGNTNFEVTGIYEDMPSSSHFHFDFIAAIHTYAEANEQVWLSFNFITYLLLKPNVDMLAFEEKMSSSLVEKYISVQAEQAIGMSWKEIQESGTNLSFSLQRLTDIHLQSNHDGELMAPGNISIVRIFAIIALFIIIIACINFTNLSTARSVTRLSEVGIRKTFGVTKGQLIKQFISESIIIVFIAHMLAMILVEVSLPYFNELTGKDLSVSYLSVRYIFSMLALIMVTGFLAGSYPAFYLSSFRPITILRGELLSRSRGISFRSILVIVQFFISLVLLAATMILAKQMRFMQHKELGFDKEQVLVIDNTYLLNDQASAFKGEVMKYPEVQNASLSGYMPIPSARSNSSVFPDAIVTENMFNCENWVVDHDYVKTWGLNLADGRVFSLDHPTDSMAILINETAAIDLGWDEPVGRLIGMSGDYDKISNGQLDVYTVIGVVEDFHFESMHAPIEPMLLFLGQSRYKMALRLAKNTNIASLLKDVEKLWKEFAPDQPFSYTFVDQRLQQEYQSEQKMGKIMGMFTIFAFFVSSLGLIGLSIFTSEQRRKEIGLRKVSGSGIGQIIWLLSKDFSKLVVVSFVFSVPVTVIFMQKWLNSFAYKTSISWWIFLLTLLMTYFVALIAIVSQSYKAASSNPVDTFRTD